jgi:hypothetical protein
LVQRALLLDRALQQAKAQLASLQERSGSFDGALGTLCVSAVTFSGTPQSREHIASRRLTLSVQLSNEVVSMKPKHSILDSSFQYVPAHATSVSQTWSRFGWRPPSEHGRRHKAIMEAAKCDVALCVTRQACGLNGSLTSMQLDFALPPARLTWSGR